MIGASPLLSALFHDEPTIEAFNLMGLDLNAVGNHEFDRGAAELLRMQNGGCNPVTGCQDGDGFAGANFQFLAANVVRKSGDLNPNNDNTLFPAYKIRSFGGAKIAFIGMTLEATPTIVTPSGITGLEFKDEADTVNALIPRLKQQGVEAIVVLIHEGGVPVGDLNTCSGISGPIVDIVNRTSQEVDLFITGHTHQAYNCIVDGRVVTSAASFGRLVTDIDLTLDRKTGQPTAIKANNVIVTRDVPKAPLLTALIEKYTRFAAPLANRVIGSILADITRAPNAAGESALGDVIADTQLAATADPALGGAVVAFMNPGGIRADLVYASSPKGEGNGFVTYEEAFTVQPFGNNLVTLTLTGAQLKTLLEQQFVGCSNNQPFNRILQVSSSLAYSWSSSGAACNKVDPASIQIKGQSISPQNTYRITVNSFLADGGDNFTVLRDGTNRLGGALDLDALESYFKQSGVVSPGSQNRITLLP
jgi:5'-nucleotidase